VALRTVGVKLTAEYTNYVSGVKKASYTTKALAETLSKQETAMKKAGTAGKTLEGSLKSGEVAAKKTGTSVKGLVSELARQEAAAKQAAGSNKTLSDRIGEQAQQAKKSVGSIKDHEQALRREESALKGAAASTEKATKTLAGQDSGLRRVSSSLEKAGNSAKEFGGKLAKGADSGKFDGLADKVGVAGIAMAGAFTYAVKQAADFDKQMSAVSAATHAGSKDMAQLRQAALDAGKATQYSATGAAEAITELSKAGVSTADVLNGGLNGALSLAAAGQLDLGEAAETAASAMTQFGLSGDAIPHVADLLSAAAGKAQGSVHDMGAALNQAGLVAAQSGANIEETVGTLAAFASAGLLGSDAGTSFKTMLLAIQAPSGKTQELMDQLGISAYDAGGNFIGLSKFAGVLKDRLSTLTPQARAAAMAQIFGNDAVRAASILYKQGAEGIDDWIKKSNEAGYANATAAELTNNLSGDIERLQGSLETLAIQGGSGANKGLRALTQTLNDMVNRFADMPGAVSETMTILAGLGAVLALGGVAWMKYRKFVAEAQEQLIATGPAGERAATALGRVSAILGKAAVWGVAAEVVASIADHFDHASISTEKFNQSITEFANSGKVTGEMAKQFGTNFDKLGEVSTLAQSADSGFGHFMDTVVRSIPVVGSLGVSLGELGQKAIFGDSFQTAKEKYDQLNASLTAFAESTHDSARANQMWQQIVLQSGLDVEQLAKLMPDAYQAVGKLNTESMKSRDSLGGTAVVIKDLTGKTEEYASAAEASTAALHGQRDALAQLSSMMKAETDPVFGLLTAQENLTTAQKKASKAIKEHGKNSAEARDATRELALAAIDLQGKAGAVASTFNGKLTPEMLATFRAAKLTDAQIQAVSGQFVDAKKTANAYAQNWAAHASAPGAPQSEAALRKAYEQAVAFDGTYKAFMSTPGGKAAENQAKSAWDKLEGFDGNWVANIKTTGYTKVAGDLRHLLAAQQALKDGVSVSEANREMGHFFATGGHVQGPGTGTSDSIPAMLSDGEFVIKAASVKKLGPGALGYINATGELPAYAGGGAVRMPFPTTAKKTKIPADQTGGVGSTYAGGGSLGAWIRTAMALTGVPGNWAGPLHTLIMRESGGNPNAINLWDSNAKAGHPSQGLMQTIPGTFAAYRLKSLPNSITNPIANIAAGIRYILSRYGSIFNVQQANASKSPKGYVQGGLVGHTAMAGGGLISEPIFGVGRSGRTYSFGETGPERVIPGYASGGMVTFEKSSRTTSTGKAANSINSSVAALDARDAINQLTVALRSNGTQWSVNTTKGRANRSSLIDSIKSIKEAAQAKYDETGSVKSANRVYDSYIAQLDASMKKMKVNTAARKALLAMYSQRPSYSATGGPTNSDARINFDTQRIGAENAVDAARDYFTNTLPSFSMGTDGGRQDLSQLFSYLSTAKQVAQSSYDVNHNAKSAMAIYNEYLGKIRGVLTQAGVSKTVINSLLKLYGKITLSTASNRWGGLYEHAANGALTDATIAKGGPTQYAWAEASTGGELFAPKNGDIAKTRAQVGWAVRNWWGGDVTWNQEQQSTPGAWQGQSGSGSSAPSISYQINVAVSPTANLAEVGRVTVGAIQAFEKGSGKSWRS
jgi:TP901 family phage tail tape measure protein